VLGSWLTALLVLTSTAGCASVEDLIRNDRLGDACRRQQAQDGLDRASPEATLLRDAVVARIAVNVDVIGVDDAVGLLGENLRPGASLRLGWLSWQAPADMVLHERDLSGAINDDSEMVAVLDEALMPLPTPAPPSLPPGPLVMPSAPDPSPRRSSSRSGLLDALVDLVVLPFRIMGDVGSGLMRIPLDLFGASSEAFPGGSSSSSSSAATANDPRLPGEAILPPEAWNRAAQRIRADHAAAVANVNASRAARHRRIVDLADRLRERCVVVDAVECRRLVLLSPTATTATGHVAVGLGTAGAPCAVDVDVVITAIPPAAAPPPRGDGVPQRPAPGSGTTTMIDAAHMLDGGAVHARLMLRQREAAHLSAIACRIEVKPRWRRLLKSSKALQVRIAAGTLAGLGATVTVPAAATVEAGVDVAVAHDDHIKVVVGSDQGFVGGAVGRFDGTLPMVLVGESLTATCR
jgi:hypothetical protein